MHKPLLPVILIAFGLGIVTWFTRPEAAPLIPSTLDTTYGLGEVVADFEFTTLDGETQHLTEYAAGSPVLLVLRDALCPVSRRYGNRTARLDSEFGERGVRFLYVNISPLDNTETMRQDIERYGFTSSYTDDHDWNITRSLKALTTAEVFLLDGTGRMRYRGAIDDQYGIRFTKPEPRRHYLRNALNQLLDGESIETPSTLAESCYLAQDVQRVDHHHD